MTDGDPVRPPDGPRIEPSEPVKEQMLVETAIKQLHSHDLIITIRAFAYMLDEFPVQIGEHGFLRDESGNLLEGYVYGESPRGQASGLPVSTT